MRSPSLLPLPFACTQRGDVVASSDRMPARDSPCGTAGAYLDRTARVLMSGGGASLGCSLDAFERLPYARLEVSLAVLDAHDPLADRDVPRQVVHHLEGLGHVGAAVGRRLEAVAPRRHVAMRADEVDDEGELVARLSGDDPRLGAPTEHAAAVGPLEAGAHRRPGRPVEP